MKVQVYVFLWLSFVILDVAWVYFVSVPFLLPCFAAKSHLYTVYLPSVCKLPGLPLDWLILYLDCTHTVFIDKLFILHCALTCAKSHEGIYFTGQNGLFLFFSVLLTSLFSCLFGCHFVGLFFLKHWNTNSCMANMKSCMHGRTSEEKISYLCVLGTPPIQLWMTNLKKQS
jgi:hypothetical protein